MRLIDRPGLDENPHLDYVLLEAVRAVERFRDEGRTVLLHCVETRSRTPSVAALYGARRQGVGTDEALRVIEAVLPDVSPNPAFREALQRFDSRAKLADDGSAVFDQRDKAPTEPVIAVDTNVTSDPLRKTPDAGVVGMD